MRKARNTLLGILIAWVILGTVTVAGHAQKVVPLATSKPAPFVYVTGGIIGSGDPRWIRIAFLDGSFESVGYRAGTVVISNPDYPPSLSIYPATPGPGVKTLVLSYYFCDSRDHGPSDLICTVPEHSPLNYKRLRISSGIAQKRSNEVIFPAGSTWSIGFKETGVVEQEGTLESVVIYNLIK